MVSPAVAKAEIIAEFPNIDPDQLVITSPPTKLYNCIAYAAGESFRWWWPDSNKIAFWPSKAPRVLSIMAFQTAFETKGFALANNPELEDGIEKIAFYHLNGIPTHAAKQLPDGKWSSKLGQNYDISHNLDGFAGSQYGEVALIMQRQRR